MILEKIQSSSFLSLTDTPDSYSGKSGMVVAVSSSEGALTFVSASAGVTPASTVVSETAYSQSPVVGTGSNYAREDHSHGTPTATSGSVGGASYDYYQRRNSSLYVANCTVADAMGGTSYALYANVLYGVPFIVPAGGTIDKIGMNVQVKAAAGKVCRIGIYKALSNKNLQPYTLISDCGTFPISVLGGVVVIGLSVVLDGADFYWFVWNSDANWTCLNVPKLSIAPTLGYIGNLTVPDSHIYKSQTYGALPNPFPSGCTFYGCVDSTAMPLVWYYLSS